jgi:hypothetical protein
MNGNYHTKAEDQGKILLCLWEWKSEQLSNMFKPARYLLLKTCILNQQNTNIEFGGDCWTLRKFNVGPTLVQLGYLHMPNSHKLGRGCGKLIPIQQRQEYRRKLLFVPVRRRHNCLPELSGRPGRVHGAVAVACAWILESKEDIQIKGKMRGTVWMSSLCASH